MWRNANPATNIQVPAKKKGTIQVNTRARPQSISSIIMSRQRVVEVKQLTNFIAMMQWSSA